MIFLWSYTLGFFSALFLAAASWRKGHTLPTPSGCHGSMASASTRSNFSFPVPGSVQFCPEDDECVKWYRRSRVQWAWSACCLREASVPWRTLGALAALGTVCAFELLTPHNLIFQIKQNKKRRGEESWPRTHSSRTASSPAIALLPHCALSLQDYGYGFFPSIRNISKFRWEKKKTHKTRTAKFKVRWEE